MANSVTRAAASALLGVAFCASCILTLAPAASASTPALAPNSVALRAQSESASPSPTSDSTRDGDMLTNSKQEELENRYGHDRDIATPPLLVKRATNQTNKYVAEPLKLNHQDHLKPPAGAPKPPATVARSFNVTRNAPVIKHILNSQYQTPADEFLSKAYLGMGMLALVAVVLGGVVAVRYRARGSAIDDFDYSGQ